MRGWMRAAMTTVAACVLLGVVAGCESVSSPIPLGVPVAPQADELSNLSGTWLSDDGHAITVRQRAGGELRIAWIEDGGKGEEFEFKLRQFRGLLTLEDGGYFVNLLSADDDPSVKQRYHFMRIVGNAERMLVLQPAKVDVWRAAVEDGMLPGKVVKGEHSLDVPLSASAEQLSDFVTEANVRSLFDGDKPMILRRTTDVK